MTYILGSVRGILSYRNQQVFVRYDEGEAQRIDMTLLCIANGRYFGAGMWVCPMAELDDGLFDALELRSMSRSKLLATLAKVFKGKHLRVKGVHTRRVQRIEVEPVWSENEVRLELDGEPAGRLPASFEVAHRRLKLRAP